MKKLREKVAVLTLIVLSAIVVIKVYCFAIVDRIYYKIDAFRKIDNRYYAVTVVENGNMIGKQEIFCKGNQVKYLKLNENIKVSYFEFKDFNKDEKYFLVIKKDGSKKINYIEGYIKNKSFIIGTPNSISSVYKNDKFNLKEFLNIYYVIPVKYEDKKCYKIVTKYETIIIDKETFLPKYSCKNWVNSEDDNLCKMEYFYEFEINTVTEEDMQKL